MTPQPLSEAATLTSREDLLEHASLSVLNGIAGGIPGIVEWGKSHLINTPLVIYDLNGKPLFFDFTAKSGSRVLGTVRTGASKILGAPVIAHELGPRYWNFDDAVRKLTPMVERDYPGRKILRTRLVCYSYPKLGVMVEFAEGGEPSRLIFDVSDLSLIPEKPVSDVEGAYAWSFYGSLPERVRQTGVDLYKEFDAGRLRIPKTVREGFKGNSALIRSLGTVEGAIPTLPITSATKQLQFCTHYGYSEPRSHHCFVLHGQQKNDYCAVATGQMILCYYRYYYTQDQIAPKFNYHTGGCPPDTSAGYEALTCNHLDATYDSSPTWEKARSQIDALHPLKSGISRHARACAGYSSTLFTIPPVSSLYIYDPWPPDPDYKKGGAVYWETWSSIQHTNFIYTRVRCP